MKNEDKKEAYVKKMDRQMKDWQSKIQDIERTAKIRGASKNDAIKGKIDEVKKAASSSHSGLDSVRSSGNNWAEEAKSASANYRRMKAIAEDLGSRIKKK